MSVETRFHNLEEIARAVVDHGYRLYLEIGPGLLESAYDAFLAAPLRDTGFQVQQQLSLPATAGGVTITNAFRIDLLVEGILILEIKSVEKLAPVHTKQVLTYLRMTDLPVGFLMNFGAETYRTAVRRVIDNRHPYHPPK
jgi:GxxExxY protein